MSMAEVLLHERPTSLGPTNWRRTQGLPAGEVVGNTKVFTWAGLFRYYDAGTDRHMLEARAEGSESVSYTPRLLNACEVLRVRFLQKTYGSLYAGGRGGKMEWKEGHALTHDFMRKWGTRKSSHYSIHSTQCSIIVHTNLMPQGPCVFT